MKETLDEKQAADRMFWGCLGLVLLNLIFAWMFPGIAGLFMLSAVLFGVGALSYWGIGFDGFGTRPKGRK